MSDIDVRPCQASDIPGILDLWKQSDVVPGPTDNAHALRLRLERDRELFVLATDGDRIVACLIAGWNGWRADMARLAVHPDYRRRGIAARLVATVEEHLRGLGCSRITILVNINEPGAPEFWSNVGYEPHTEVGPYTKGI